MRAIVCETRTGSYVADLDVSAWSYDTGILAPDKCEVTVPAYTRRALSMDLIELLTPFKYSLALIDDTVEGVSVVRAAGPITARPPEDDVDGRQSFKVTARGPETLLQYRHIRKFPGWPLLTAGKPNGTYDMSLKNLSLGTIIKRLVAESELFSGGALPILYEADRAGIHERLYEAIDGKPVLDALDDIGALNDGIEYDFIPEVDELDNLSYRLVTGLDGDGRIIGTDALTWNTGGARPDIRGWEPNDLISEVATDAYFVGGKGDDVVLMARSIDSTLVNDGWPRVEVWDSSHSTVSVQSTLQSWADGRVSGVYNRPQFEVRAGSAFGVRHGDVVEIQSQGHWLLPDGEPKRRLMSVNQSSSNPDWVGVSLV